MESEEARGVGAAMVSIELENGREVARGVSGKRHGRMVRNKIYAVIGPAQEIERGRGRHSQ